MIPTSHRRRSVPLAILLVALSACGEVEAVGTPQEPAGETQTRRPSPPLGPLRVRLFDRMDEAELEEPGRVVPPPVEPLSVVLDFDERSAEEIWPDGIWFGRPRDGRIDYQTQPAAAIDPAAGRSGAGLCIGPGVAEDTSRVLLVLPASGAAHVRISGRVRLVGNPLADEASSHEVLRVIEHTRNIADPTRRSRRDRVSASTHRVSRSLDPSGWDRIEYSFLSRPRTETLELQLLHRSGGSPEAVTIFDDIRVEQVPLTRAEILDRLRQRYRPHDGGEAATPWRLRVSLQRAGYQEVRDAVLLPPPASLSIPVSLPAAEHHPRLRFHYGMLPEAVRTCGDGARIEVSFRTDEGRVVPMSSLRLDPRGDRAQRSWVEARLDLAAVAGLTGRLVFASLDVDQDAGSLDAVVLATPRIEPGGEEPPTFNVLLIGVDTLRADHMSAFGYSRPTTPNLRALSEVGVSFPRTRSQAPWTLPSFSSITTSLYPSTHGAGRGGHDQWTPIDPTTTSLAEILARVGFETQGMVANGLISPEYGLDQGFDAYRWAWGFESGQSDAQWVSQFVADHDSTPWFLFWHIMDPHLPYQSAESYRSEFTDEAYGGRFLEGGVPFHDLDPRPGRRWFTHEGPPPPPDLTEDDRRFVSDSYDAELAEMDAAVGHVLDALRENGQWERTIVAFVADHGEGLGDHDHYHHGYTLFDDQVHIPMLLRIPGRDEGRVVDRPVASIDLAPTILGALGLEPPDFFQGVDRLAADAPAEDAYFIEYPTYDSSAQKAWIQGDFKYLHDPVFHTEALYHLGLDPAERTDVAAQYPEVVARARAALDEFRWKQLQKGRFHLRIHGVKGQRLVLRIETDDLFDANFAGRPAIPEGHFAMDLQRHHLELDTVLPQGRFELVFWCRGEGLNVSITLDGQPPRGGLGFGGDEDPVVLPAELARAAVPVHERSDVAWPEPGGASLWLEAGVEHGSPVAHTPEELEMLRELGYGR